MIRNDIDLMTLSLSGPLSLPLSLSLSLSRSRSLALALSRSLSLSLALARINLILVLAIVKFWFLNTNGADAAFHQLRLYKDLQSLRPHSPPLVDADEKRLQNHLWFLSEEITPLVLTSSLVTYTERARVAEVHL